LFKAFFFDHISTAFLYVFTYVHIFDCGENVRTPHGISRVWPRPGKEPHQDVDGTVFVSIHDESTFHATIGPLPQGHGLQFPTPAALFGRVAFLYEMEVFPRHLAFVGQHLDKRTQSPVVIDRPVQVFVPLSMLVHDHLSLRKVSDHHGSLNQLMGD
jgi:hypothetical protein